MGLRLLSSGITTFYINPKEQAKETIQRFRVPRRLSIISLPGSVSWPFINRDAASREKNGFPTLFPSSSGVIHHSNLFWKGHRVYFSCLWERMELCAEAAPQGSDWGWKCPRLGVVCPSPIRSGCLLHQNHVQKIPLSSFDPGRLLSKGILSNPSSLSGEI